jgi:hypothetical protein
VKKKSRARRRATLNPTAAPSAGGKAEAAGSLYETLTAAWYTHRILLGKSTQPVLELPSGAQLTSLICQSDAPVDDVNAYTSDGGILFVQVKRTVSLSTRADSAFASAVDQFVHQYQGCASSAVARPWARPLDASRDRLVLVTRGASSAKITRVLPRLLRGIRDRADVLSLKDVATSGGECRLSSRRGPLLAHAPLRTGHASWPSIRLKHGLSPRCEEPTPGYRSRGDPDARSGIDVDRKSAAFSSWRGSEYRQP